MLFTLMDMKEDESFKDFVEHLNKRLSLHGNEQDLESLELVYEQEFSQLADVFMYSITKIKL